MSQALQSILCVQFTVNATCLLQSEALLGSLKFHISEINWSVEMINVWAYKLHIVNSSQLVLSINCCGWYTKMDRTWTCQNVVMHTVMTFHQIFIDWIDAVDLSGHWFACMRLNGNAVNWTNIQIDFAKPNVWKFFNAYHSSTHDKTANCLMRKKHHLSLC